MSSVAPPLVFDTNSLWNFAVVERLDIIETRYGDRAAWTETVADEVDSGERYEPALGQVRRCPWLGRPLGVAKTKCLTDVATIQRILAAPGDRATMHLGESECIHIIEHELNGDGLFVTDDVAAADLARRRGIRVLSTPDILNDAFTMGEMQCPEPFRLLEEMVDNGRGVYLPRSHTEVC